MLPCVICSFEALSEKHLRMHMQNEHDDSVITCEKCNKSCKGGRKFKTHMNSHREVNCKHCGKKIPYNSTTSHVTKCIGEKSFKCENCPAVFNTEGDLKVHVTNKSCPIKCNLCDKTLKNAGFLDRHMASVHSVRMQVVKTSEGHIGLFQSVEVQNNLHCTLCDFIATKASRLKRHMITHNPKPVKVERKVSKM